MNQDLHNILQELKSGDMSGFRLGEVLGRLEMVLIRYPLNPDLDDLNQIATMLRTLPCADPDVAQGGTLIRCFIRLGRIQLASGDIQLAEKSFIQAVSVADSAKEFRSLAIAHMEIGEMARRQGDLAKAKHHQEKALEIGESHYLPREQADALNNLANIAIESGLLDLAETQMGQSLAIAESISELRLEGHIYNNLGVIKCIRGNFEDAIVEFSRSIPLREITGDQKGLSESYHNLGLAYLDSGNPVMAKLYVQKALDLAQSIKDKIQESHIMLTMAELVYHDKDFPYALSMAEQLTQRQQNLNDQMGLADASKLIGNIYFGQGILKKAEEYFSRAISMFQRLGVIPGEAESLKAMGLCCQKQGRVPESLDFFKKAKSLFKRLGNMHEYELIHSLQQNSIIAE